MKLSSLETTPNPNCMKLNLDEQVVETPLSLRRGQVENVPDAIKQLLNIQGVREAFLANNFITLTRQGNADWQPILAEAAQLLGVTADADPKLLKRSDSEPTSAQTSTLGEVEIAVLVFRGIPVQVRAIGAEAQTRVSLPDRFNDALQRVLQATGANYVQERQWEPYPPRNGQPEEVAKMVADEIASLIDPEELKRREAAITNTPLEAKPVAQPEDSLAQLSDSNWKTRLKAIQTLEVNTDTFPALVNALNDELAAIRRWAAALLGASAMSEAVDFLGKAVLSDPSVVVRRTAGDALSDLGDPRATAVMGKALADPSKLVRWRAARFLNETGDETAIEALKQAIACESEFDVELEMKAALERITSGGDRSLPMWMRLSQSD